MFHTCTYFPSILLSYASVTNHGLRSFTILTLSSVRSRSPINLRASVSISTSSGTLFVNVLIKTGMECTTKSFAFLTGNLWKWNYRLIQLRQTWRLATLKKKRGYTCALWARQDRFRTIRRFAFTFWILGFVVFLRSQVRSRCRP